MNTFLRPYNPKDFENHIYFTRHLILLLLAISSTVTPSRREKHILLNFTAARRVFDFFTSMTSLEVNCKDTSTFRVSFKSGNEGLFAGVSFVTVQALDSSKF